MKKIFSLPAATALLLCLCVLQSRAGAQGILRENIDEDLPKIISVIFDDSGSMVGIEENKNTYTTRWVDADYALKALTAMMNPEDQLRLYTMGDYKSGDKRKPDVYNVQTKDTAISALEAKMSERTYGDTYSYALDAAREDFSVDDIKKYECWIVILTDGIFNRPEVLDADRLTSKLNDLIYPVSGDGIISVAYIPMGTGAVELTNDADSRIVQEDREDGITIQITKLLNRIYKRVRMDDKWMSQYLPIQDDEVILRTDVPMEKLVVFLQYQGREGLYKDRKEPTNDEITILDSSRKLGELRYLELEGIVSFGGKDELPKKNGKAFDTELIRYHTLRGVILTWERGSQVGGVDFGNQTLSIPIQKGLDITAEVYYQPAVSIGYNYLQDGEPVEHTECAFVGQPMNETEYCLYEGKLGVSLKLLDFQGKALLNENSPFLYPEEFTVSLVPLDGGAETVLRRSGGYSYVEEVLEGDYQMQVQTPWNEIVTQDLSVQERRMPLEVAPEADRIVVDADEEEQRLVQLRVWEDGGDLRDESRANLSIECATEDQDLIVGPMRPDSDGSYGFPVSLRDPSKHQIAKTARFHVTASRAYNRGASVLAEQDVELELTSGPHTMEFQCEAGEVDALSCMLKGQKFDISYFCDGEELTAEQLKNLEASVSVSEDGLEGLFKIGADKNLVACLSPRWWGVSEQTVALQVSVHYVKYNRQAEGEPLSVELKIRPVPLAFTLIFLTVAGIVVLWVALCVAKLFTLRHIRKQRFVMSGAVINFPLQLKRKRNLFLPFYRSARLVMAAGRSGMPSPVPALKLVIRNSESGNGYVLCNYDSFKSSELYHIGGLPITKNNCNFNNERCFSVKNSFGEIVKLQIIDKR